MNQKIKLANNIGKRIRMIRVSNGETQQTMAKKLCLSRSMLSNIECGYSLPSVEEIIKIANVYGVSTDWLCGVSFSEETFNEIDDEIANFLRFTLFKQFPDIFDEEWALQNFYGGHFND